MTAEDFVELWVAKKGLEGRLLLKGENEGPELEKLHKVLVQDRLRCSVFTLPFFLSSYLFPYTSCCPSLLSPLKPFSWYFRKTHKPLAEGSQVWHSTSFSTFCNSRGQHFPDNSKEWPQTFCLFFLKSESLEDPLGWW